MVQVPLVQVPAVDQAQRMASGAIASRDKASIERVFQPFVGFAKLNSGAMAAHPQDQLQLIEESVDAATVARSGYIWSAASDGEDVTAAKGAWLDSLHGWAMLSGYDIRPGTAHQSALSRHLPHDTDDRLSNYSDMRWSKLLRKEWYESDISCRLLGDGMQHCSWHACGSEVCHRFHGTTLQAAVSMLRTGGFIPGPNGHGYKSKYLQGLFCASTLGEALMRVDSWRHAKDHCLKLSGCPVVVELEVAAIKLRRYHSTRLDLRVIPGEEGALMTGVKLCKIHINKRILWNFCQAEKTFNVTKELACKGTCGMYIHSERQMSLCKGWTDPEGYYKSKSGGHVYCPHCAGWVTNNHTYIGMPLE